MNEIRIATLNFSGINTSPFEYHNGTKQKSELNDIFQQLLDEYNQKHPDTKWDIGKLDKIFNRERYSLLYRADCGFVRKRLVSQKQFHAIWDRTFDLNQGIVGHMNLKDELIDKIRVFDWMVYIAFLRFVFGNVDMENLSQYNVETYKEELRKWHSQAFLNEDKKIDNVREFINNNQIDVMFLQQSLNKRMADLLPNDEYSYLKNQDSMVIYKKQLFFNEDKDDILFHDRYKQKLNFNKDSAYLKTKQFLLISVHLTSKSANIDQAQNMFEVLNEIQKQYKDLIIIVGADANHDIQKLYGFQAYPDNHIATTRKKRTHMQCQFSKSGKLIEQTKDLIITNRKMSSWKICTIRESKISNELLPNNEHPYDHFTIMSTLQFNRNVFPKLELENNFSNVEIRIQRSTTFQDNPLLRADTYETVLSKVKPPSDKVFVRRATIAQQSEYEPLEIYKYVSTIEQKITADKNRKSSYDFKS